MPIDISALKVLFKKVFPPKKSIYTVDTNDDGKYTPGTDEQIMLGFDFT